MKIRALNFDTDSAAIDKIWRENYSNEFSLPDLTNAVTFAVVEDKGEVIAFGIVKVFAEAMMVLAEGSTRKRVESLKLLLDKAETDSKNSEISHLHSFCYNEDFADILVDHFNFKRIKTVGLIKELKDGRKESRSETTE